MRRFYAKSYTSPEQRSQHFSLSWRIGADVAQGTAFYPMIKDASACQRFDKEDQLAVRCGLLFFAPVRGYQTVKEQTLNRPTNQNDEELEIFQARETAALSLVAGME